ncbi:MAG: molybdopterin-dependent oxidoreductase [Gemmatimonadales bacterium]|nr:molybdopterin-dependent oxidoreductase [Gemmatimonadales bacterium]NIN10659.1 molybdopterin-dependent oxidoreductase [Gemmatimonadales bacterium]NIN49421.1 molybdopterin-dependent oxidoreductase [Gemmatimonadales bacterium]NIP06885.1 molybdopterin-dependent oxidoreductase [Gemmatimonadales bacterium]NIR01559.1 molybdopterin-dependent oxidoreductase [Gemmatimonadales bacterium]
MGGAEGGSADRRSGGLVHRSADPANRRTAEPALRVVGTAQRKVDAVAKVTGQTLFADDLFLPRMLYGKLLRSTQPHARILCIDTSKAAALEGVKAIVTGQDLPIPFGILPVSQDEHALCPERVRYIGDPVAAVAAVSEETATQAVELIEVEYEPLTSITSVQQAVATPEPRIHDYGPHGNLHKLINLEFGDVERALAESDYVREDLLFYEGSTHLPMEQHAAVADWSADGKLTLWSATQTPHYVHRALTKVLELPASRIRVIACPNGGGFGGKSDVFNHEIAVAKLAMETGRPVKITLTRDEVFYCHRGRHPTLMWVRTGVTKDGAIKGMHFRSLLDGGGYGSYGVASAYYTGALQTVTYNVERYKFQGARVFTNKAPCGPKRGHGTPQPRYALEIHLDKIAEDLGKDPAELRLKHLVSPDSITANYLRVGSVGLETCIRKVTEGAGWKEKYGKLPYGRGVGLACSSYISGAGLPIYWNAMPQSGVQLKLDRGGGVTVFCGSTEIGQGSDSILAYIVSEVLGVGVEDVHVVTGDTHLTPVDLGSYSSRVTLMTGNAALQAAERAREILARNVAAKLEVPMARLAFADGRVFDTEGPHNGMSFAAAVQLSEAAEGTVGTVGSYTPPDSPGRYRGAGVGPSPAYSYTAAIAEVAVDAASGIVVVPKIWIAHDVGQCINPVAVMGQVEGSVYMGLGEALMEEMAYRPNRNVIQKMPSMLEYKSPTTLEMCDVVTYLIEDPDPNGPFGAKEVGQGPLLPVAPAIANAVYDAVGVRIDEVPITPEKVLKALKKKEKGEEPRYGPHSFPEIPWPEPIRVPPPWEGGDGRAVPAGGAAGGEGGAETGHPAISPAPTAPSVPSPSSPERQH